MARFSQKAEGIERRQRIQKKLLSLNDLEDIGYGAYSDFEMIRNAVGGIKDYQDGFYINGARNILIAGGVTSGKTTLLTAILMELSPKRTFCVCDHEELSWYSSVNSPNCYAPNLYVSGRPEEEAEEAVRFLSSLSSNANITKRMVCLADGIYTDGRMPSVSAMYALVQSETLNIPVIATLTDIKGRSLKTNSTPTSYPYELIRECAESIRHLPVKPYKITAPLKDRSLLVYLKDMHIEHVQEV